MAIEQIIGRITKHLCEFLLEAFKVEENYFKKLVYPSLSFRQRETSPMTLEDLDLAALIRVVTKNNWELEKYLTVKFPREYQNYCFEMTAIRNKYAHKTSFENNIEDQIRDLDTIYRFLEPLSIDKEFKKEIRIMKEKLEENKISSRIISVDDKFAPGQTVIIKSDPTKIAVIMNEIVSANEKKYKIFIDGKIKEYFESQIKVKEQTIIKENISSANLKYLLTSLIINNPSFSTLYSLNSAKIDFIPYQFRPVLKIIHSDRPRMLLADSVGVGKTIEAGLILKELQARHNLDSILIICPKALVTEKKWKFEMRKFDEDFIELDSKTLRYCINEAELEGEWPDRYKKAILPYSLLDEKLLIGNTKKNSVGLEQLKPFPHFDLLIVDEAHHVRNTTTFRHKIIKLFTEHSEAILFLTATPIQLHSKDLFILLNLLRSDIFIDKSVFDFMLEPNVFLNKALRGIRLKKENWVNETLSNLNSASITEYGKNFLSDNPEFQAIYDNVNEKISDEERMKLLASLERMNSFYQYLNRTRRRDIGNFTIRNSNSFTVDFTDSQKEMYDKVIKIYSKYFTKRYDLNIRFLMTTILRQAASSIFGLIPFINDALKKRMNFINEDGLDDEIDQFDVELTEGLIQEFELLKEEFQYIDKYDPKIEKLIEIINQKLKLENNKVMLFSTFRHTLKYIYERIVNENLRVGLIHGGIKDEERLQLKIRFEKHKSDSDAIDILLFSEVGAEGLDYQFCDCIINYDLPWNPMKIEQRIGRIDRNGQMSEKIMIYNLLTPGTIDYDIYERCLKRIKIFETSIGENEAILGQISKGIINIVLDSKLSDKEKQEKMQQLTDNKYRDIIEEQELENKQASLFGFEINNQILNNEIGEATNMLINTYFLTNSIKQYFINKLNKKEVLLGDKEEKTIRLSSESKSIILDDFLESKIKKSATLRSWEKWLKKPENYLKVTFDSKTARKDDNIQLLNPSHPLIKQASNGFDFDKKYYCVLKTAHNGIDSGHYPFIAFKWEYKGLRDDLKIKIFSNNKVIDSEFYKIIQFSEDFQKNIEYNDSDFNILDSLHYKQWQREKNLHYDNTYKTAEFKKESLKISFNARIAQKKDVLSKSSDDKIIKMYEREIENIEFDYNKRISEIEQSIEKVDIITSPVVFGFIIK